MLKNITSKISNKVSEIKDSELVDNIENQTNKINKLLIEKKEETKKHFVNDGKLSFIENKEAIDESTIIIAGIIYDVVVPMPIQLVVSRDSFIKVLTKNNNILYEIFLD